MELGDGVGGIGCSIHFIFGQITHVRMQKSPDKSAARVISYEESVLHANLSFLMNGYCLSD